MADIRLLHGNNDKESDKLETTYWTRRYCEEKSEPLSTEWQMAIVLLNQPMSHLDRSDRTRLLTWPSGEEVMLE